MTTSNDVIPEKGKSYVLRVKGDDGEVMPIPVSHAQLEELFRNWQNNVPEFYVQEPIGMLVATDELSPREDAIVRAALNAYHEAGRLNLEWDEDWEADHERAGMQSK